MASENAKNAPKILVLTGPLACITIVLQTTQVRGHWQAL